MGKSRFIELMVKNLGKSATQAELKELESYLDSFPEYQKMHHITDALTHLPQAAHPQYTEDDLQEGINRLWDDLEKSTPVKPLHRKPVFAKTWFKAAAILLFASIAGSIYYSQNHPAVPALSAVRHLKVPYGKTVELTLEDGTKVKLNSGSSFDYPTAFAESKREVILDGEGFFVVTKNAHKPFIVHTARFDVKVLGTVFNVKAYHDDKHKEATLLSGKIQLQMNGDQKRNYILSPNQKFTLSNTPLKSGGVSSDISVAEHKDQITVIPKITKEIARDTAWLSNKIIFINEDFEQVARQLERKYDVQITFDNSRLKYEQISGVFENERLEKALGYLKMTTPFDFKIEGRNVLLTEKSLK